MNIDFAQLEHAVDTYRRFLTGNELQIFDISSLDRIGIPIYLASARGEGGFLNNGVGYGNTPTEAMVGALGEMSETFHVHQALKVAPACESVSYSRMVNHFGLNQVIDPLTLCLSAGYPYHDKLPLRWVAVTRWSDGALCWAPREAVAYSGFSYDMRSNHVELENNDPYTKLFPPITCGLGAGLTIEQALSHGVLELLQRDGNCTTFRAMDQGIDIELDVIESEEIKATLSHLENLGLRVRVKLASTEFGLVNLFVIAEPLDSSKSTEAFPLIVTACGEAVHQNRERALRKALHEFISSRSRKTFMHGSINNVRALASVKYLENNLDSALPHLEEPKALTEMAGWLTKSQAELYALLRNTVFSSHKKIKFSSLSSTADDRVLNPIDRLADLTKRLQAENIDIYYFDGSPSGADGPKIVRAIAPGLEGETLSYWRIGSRGAKRLLARQSSLVSQDLPQAQQVSIPLRAADQEALGGPVFFKVPEWEKVLHGHYPLYREPSPHTAQKYLGNHGS